MLFIDLTKELGPILLGLNVGLIISAAALVAERAVNSAFHSIARFQWRRQILHRPLPAR